MNNYDISQKLQSLLAQSKISEESLQKLIGLSKGKNIVNSLSAQDKEKLANAFMSMSNEDIKNKLSKADFSSIAGMSADDILKKLR